MTNTIQKKFKVSSTQLLYQSCPYQAATLLIFGPYLDKLLTNQNVFGFKYTTQVTVRVNLLSKYSQVPTPFLNVLSTASFCIAGFHYSFLPYLHLSQF